MVCLNALLHLKVIVFMNIPSTKSTFAEDASDMADVIQACSSFPSSISSGASPDSSYRCSELRIENEDECIDGTEYSYENINDTMDLASVVSSISTVSRLHRIVVVDVVDLTNDDELHPANLSIDGSHQVELPNEVDEAQLPNNESQ